MIVIKYEKIKEYSNTKFRRITGVKKHTFEEMIKIMKIAELIRRSKGGPKPKLSIEDMLLIMLEYLREYRTYAHIAVNYGLSESQIFRIVKWAENIFIKDGTFSLPGKKALLKSNIEYKVILIDATESPIERPKKNRIKCAKKIKNRKNKQKKYYSGKKKRHTIKTQIVVNKKTKNIICTAFSEGKKHDFKLFKESKTHISKDTQVDTDTGYQGIKKIHLNSVLPKKKTKKCPLTPEEKAINSKISSERVQNEHAIGFIKRFKILSERYRNRRKRFGLRLNLIAGICNFELIA